MDCRQIVMEFTERYLHFPGNLSLKAVAFLRPPFEIAI